MIRVFSYVVFASLLTFYGFIYTYVLMAWTRHIVNAIVGGV